MLRFFFLSGALLVGCAARVPETTPQPTPRNKAYALTPDDELGTLPDGVGIPVGEHAPSALVEDADGHPVELEDLWHEGRILLVFYRGGWCPYCNFQVRSLTEAYDQFRSRGVRPVMVSVDRIEESAKTQRGWDTPFPVLSDPDLKLHEAFSVIQDIDDTENERLTGFGIDIEAASGRSHHKIAIPSIFLIDTDGTVRWAHADRRYKVRPSNAQLLEAIDSVTGSSD